MWMEYIKIFELLEKRNIRYLICGGLAVNIYGIPRMTADIDILLDFEEENVLKFENVMKQLSYLSSVPVKLNLMINEDERKKLVNDKNMLVYSFYNSVSGFMTLDVLMDTPITFAEMWNDKEVRKSGDIEFKLVSIEHLIMMKTYANRQQDKSDIILLSKLLKNEK